MASPLRLVLGVLIIVLLGVYLEGISLVVKLAMLIVAGIAYWVATGRIGKKNPKSTAPNAGC